MAEEQERLQKKQAHTPNKNLCRFYYQSRCHYGDRCKFIHRDPDVSVQGLASAVSSIQTRKHTGNLNEARDHQRERGNVEHKSKGICWQWSKAGECDRGASCRFSHPAPLHEAKVEGIAVPLQRKQKTPSAGFESLRDDKQASETLALRKREDIVKSKAAKVDQQETARRESERRRRMEEATQQREMHAQRETERERQAEESRARQRAEEALRLEREISVTAQHIVLGSTLITYEAGVTIRRVVSGFDSCRLTVMNLPLDVRHEEIIALFTQQGIDQDDVHILDVKPMGNLRQATILTGKTQGEAIAVGLDGVEFRNERLRFETSNNISSDAMGESPAQTDPDTLTITWRAPSTAMIVTYGNMDLARQKARALNNTLCGGRRVKADLSPFDSTHYDPSTIKLIGLPLHISLSEVEAFAGSCAVTQLKPNDYNLPEAFDVLRRHLHVQGMASFDIVSDNRADGLIMVRARFESRELALRAHDSIHGKRLRPGYPIFQPLLSQSLHFVSTITSQQYRAQKRLWDSLSQGNEKAAHMRIQENKKIEKVFIGVMGDDKKAVGALKVRVETLVAGERLDANLWHRSFTFLKGREFLAKVYSETGVYARCDWKVHVLKVYGDGQAKEDARQMISGEIARLALLECTTDLKNRRVVGYFIRKGLAALKEIIGEDCATLDLTSRPCKLVIRGGEEARHALNTIMDQAFNDTNVQSNGEGSDTCPICTDEVSHPCKLVCKHVYCTNCIRHYLASASGSKSFPLACMGDDAKCNTPIPIPVIKRFLTRQQYDHLIETAFAAYLDQHPKDFRYCTTPDCTQIYRTNTETMLKCPSCFAEVCSSCHEEAHEGMPCEERSRRKAQEEEQLNADWAATNGVKKCPSCQVWIQKTEGCNHVACKCGAHICWTCMGAFPKDVIYAHLREAHGRIFDAAPNVADDHQHALALQRELNAQGRVELNAELHRPYRVERTQQQVRVLAQEGEDRHQIAAEQRRREANRGCVVM